MHTIRRELPRLLLLGLALACMALMVACAAPPAQQETPEGGLRVYIEPQRWQQCQREGGCSVVTGKELAAALTAAEMQGAFAGAQTCTRRGQL